MPPSTRSAGTTVVMRATFSTPFCSESTVVASETIGAIARAAARVWCDLVVTMMRSGAGPAGSARARTGASHRVPSASRTTISPACRSASR